MEAPAGTTGVAKDVLKDFSSTAISLPEEWNFKVGLDHKGETGVYAFHSVGLDQYYVGSSIDIYERLQGHYESAAGSSKLICPGLVNVVTELGWEDFEWRRISTTHDYFSDYLMKHRGQGAVAQTYQILNFFTTYEMRLHESSLMTYLNPAMNRGDVAFPVNWDPSNERWSTQDTRPIIATVEGSGEIYPLPSINEGTRFLEINRWAVRAYMNWDKSVYSPALKENVFLSEEGATLKTGNPHVRLPKLDATTPIDYKALPLNKIVAYNTDWEEINTFDNAHEAAREYGIPGFRSVSSFFNKGFVRAIVAGVTTAVFFARNPDSNLKMATAVVVTDLLSNEPPVLYPSVHASCLSVGLKITNSGFVKKHIKGDEPYKGRYQFCYYSQYEGPTPQISKKT